MIPTMTWSDVGGVSGWSAGADWQQDLVGGLVCRVSHTVLCMSCMVGSLAECLTSQMAGSAGVRMP